MRIVEAAAAELSPHGIAVLGEVMDNKNAPAIARVRAVEIVLNRGCGMPRQQIDVTTTVLDNMTAEDQRVIAAMIERMSVPLKPAPLTIEHDPAVATQDVEPAVPSD